VLPQVESKEEYVTICYGETYTWAENGKTYTQSTTDSIVYTTIHGCDSIVTLNLTILPPVDNTIITDTICSGNSYTWPANGKTYFTDAVDTVILSDRNGCDSVLILQLTQVAKIETVFSDTICYGDTLVWNVNGQEYTTSAVDSIILPSSQGCDSIVKLNLTVLPEIPETVYTDTICEGNTYIWSVTGQTYTTTTDTSVVLTSINGCFSATVITAFRIQFDFAVFHSLFHVHPTGGGVVFVNQHTLGAVVDTNFHRVITALRKRTALGHIQQVNRSARNRLQFGACRVGGRNRTH
jgi:hypothetical protein